MSASIAVYNSRCGKRNIHEKIFINVFCISNSTLLLSALTALCPVRWNVANYHN